MAGEHLEHAFLQSGVHFIAFLVNLLAAFINFKVAQKALGSGLRNGGGAGAESGSWSDGVQRKSRPHRQAALLHWRWHLRTARRPSGFR